MHSILIQSEINDREALIAKLWEWGTMGLIENQDTVQAFFEDGLSVSWIVEQLGCAALKVSNELTQAELVNPLANPDPIYAGQHFFIVSSDMVDPAPTGRKRLVIDATDAFGSGSHESTQLVIQALEEYLPVNATVLDVGCGSGILSAVAQELGASQVFGCDTHIGALSAARRHSPTSYFFAGSVDALAPFFVDVVVVNIGASIIDRLANELYRVIKPTGIVILAGFTIERTPTRVHPQKALKLNDWLCWLCQPESIELIPLTESLQPFPEQWW